MANRLTMAKRQAILSLHCEGWWNREIARELDVDRGDGRKVRPRSQLRFKTSRKRPLASAGTREQATEPRGSSLLAEPPGDETGAEVRLHHPPCRKYHSIIQNQPKAHRLDAGFWVPVRAIAPGMAVRIEPSAAAISSEKDGGRSACEPYRQVILESWSWVFRASEFTRTWCPRGLTTGITACADSWPSCKGPVLCRFAGWSARWARRHNDFGTGAWIELPDGGARRRSHVFRIVLSFSRKGYCEAVYRQTTENSFAASRMPSGILAGSRGPCDPPSVFSAMTRREEESSGPGPRPNPKMQSFCEHYGVVILPTKPRTPRHKGKIESAWAMSRTTA